MQQSYHSLCQIVLASTLFFATAGGSRSTILIGDGSSFTLNNQGVIESKNTGTSTIRAYGATGNITGTVINTGTIQSAGNSVIDFENGSPANAILLQQDSGTINGNVRLGSGGGNVVAKC